MRRKSLVKFSIILIAVQILTVAGIYYIFTQPEIVQAADIEGVDCTGAGTIACTGGGISCDYDNECLAKTTGVCDPASSCPNLDHATEVSNDCQSTNDPNDCQACIGSTSCRSQIYCSDSGTCNYDCDEGWYDCNGDSSDGCESDSPCYYFLYSDNSTNSTIAGQAIEHRLKWYTTNAESATVSGYIFSFHNGSNTSIPFCDGTLSCSGLTEAQCTNCTQCSYSAASCGGSPDACSEHATQSPCETCGCTWSEHEINNTPTAFTDSAGDTVNEANAYDNDTTTSSQTLFANGDDDPSVTFHTFGENTTVYKKITLNMEYWDTSTSASDKYQISYFNSTDWVIWVAWTTGGQSKTIIRQDLTLNNTSLIQVKVAMDRVGGGDGDFLNISQIWTNSTYDSCSGDPTACGGYGEGDCGTCGCDWTAASCSNNGDCLSCSAKNNCEGCEPAGCSWDTNITEFVNDTWVAFGDYIEMNVTHADNTSDVTDKVNVSDNVYASRSCSDSLCLTGFISINFTTSITYTNAVIEWKIGSGDMGELECWTSSSWSSVASTYSSTDTTSAGSLSGCSNSNGNYSFRVYSEDLVGGDTAASISVDYIYLNGTLSTNTSWSNVTKVVNSTVGAKIKWKVYANDSLDSWNTSQTYSYLTTSAVAVTEPTNISLYLNGTEANQYLTYGDISNITASINVTGLFVELYKDEVLINNGTDRVENITDLNWFANATYTITANFTGGNSTYQNSNATFKIYMNKATSNISLFINNTEGDTNIENNTVVNITVINNVSFSVNMTTNRTGWFYSSGNSPYENTTEVMYGTVGNKINVTGWWDGNENYTSDSQTYYITLWGWANLSWTSPNDGTFTAEEIINLTCYVFDANNSIPIQNYLVSFYNETTSGSSILGTNLTNSSGYAVYQWNISDVAGGSYYPKCNITDNTTLYYNASEYYEANTTIKICNVLYTKSSELQSYIYFEDVEPGTNNNAVKNIGSHYITDSSSSPCSNLKVWIRGTGNLILGGSSIKISNVTVSNTSNLNEGFRLSTSFQLLNSTVPLGSNVYVYFWLDVPSEQSPPGVYVTSVEIKENATV